MARRRLSGRGPFNRRRLPAATGGNPIHVAVPGRGNLPQGPRLFLIEQWLASVLKGRIDRLRYVVLNISAITLRCRDRDSPAQEHNGKHGDGDRCRPMQRLQQRYDITLPLRHGRDPFCVAGGVVAFQKQRDEGAGKGLAEKPLVRLACPRDCHGIKGCPSEFAHRQRHQNGCDRPMLLLAPTLKRPVV
jgi:hypothetical protein